MGKLEQAEVVKRKLEQVESRLADQERVLELKDAELREAKGKTEIGEGNTEEFLRSIKFIEGNYEKNLRDSLELIETHREQLSQIAEKQSKKLSADQSESSKMKDDLITKLKSITSSLTADVAESHSDSDIKQIINQMQRHVAKEYKFDEKIEVSSKVEVDPEVIKLTKAVERLTASRHEGMSKELKIAHKLHEKQDSQSMHIMEDVSGIILQADKQRQKYVEEMNSLLKEINESLNKEQESMPNLDTLFPTVAIPAIQDFSIMSPMAGRKNSESKSGKGGSGFFARMKREGRLQEGPGLSYINPSGKDLDPSYSDVQPSPLLPNSESKKLNASRFGDHRKIRMPDSENESEDISSRLVPIESAPLIHGRSKDAGKSKVILMSGKRSSTRGDLNDKYPVAANRKHHSQTSIKFTEDNARLENTLFHENQEISENEHESHSSAAGKLPLCMESPYAADEYSTNNPFDDYEPKQMMGKDNLSYASNMATPRSLALSSPMNVQTQRRFEKRNIPVSFSSMANPHEKLNKYNMKTKEETEEISQSPEREGRNRRDPLARMSIDLVTTEEAESDQSKEKKDVYFSSPTDVSKRTQRSQLYLIPENPDLEPHDHPEEGPNKKLLLNLNPQAEKEEFRESSEEEKRNQRSKEEKKNSIELESEDEFSLKHKDENPESANQGEKTKEHKRTPPKQELIGDEDETKRGDTAKKYMQKHNIEVEEETNKPLNSITFEEKTVEEASEPIQPTKMNPPPKKMPPKTTLGQPLAVKKQIFKAKPKFINFNDTKEEKTDFVESEKGDAKFQEDNKEVQEGIEEKIESTAKKMHPSLITPEDSPNDNRNPPRKQSSDDNIDIDVGWGMPSKTNHDDANSDDQKELLSPEFGASKKKKHAPLEKGPTFGENELKEATEAKDPESIQEQSKNDPTSKRLFGKPPVKRALVKEEIKEEFKEEINEEPSLEKLPDISLRTETDSKLTSSPEQQSPQKKEEKRPIKKIFKQTKLVKKT